MDASRDVRRRTYLESGASRVEGWLDPGAGRLVEAVGLQQRELGISGHVGEIGIHHGKLFILLYLLAEPGEHALAIDLFQDQDQNVDQSGLGDYAAFRRNLARHAGGDEQLRLHQGNSTALDSGALIAEAGGRFRLFSVDGGHTPEITRHDLRMVAGALVEGGVLVLDDYFNEAWPGVSEGTNDFFRDPDGPGLTPVAIGGNKVLFTTGPEAARRYQDAFERRSLAPRMRETEMFGARVLWLGFQPRRVTPRAWLAGTPLGRAVRQSGAWRALRGRS